MARRTFQALLRQNLHNIVKLQGTQPTPTSIVANGKASNGSPTTRTIGPNATLRFFSSSTLTAS